MTNRERQAAEYAADQEGSVSNGSNKRWKTYVTNMADSLGVCIYTTTGTAVEIDGMQLVCLGNGFHKADGWHKSEAESLRDAASRVAEIHAAIGAQLARLLRGER